MKYKALSVRQPWAHAITWAGKTLEVRSRPISYRGDVLICSSLTKSEEHVKEDFDDYEKCTGHKVEFGKALCLATITGCEPMTEWEQIEDAFMEGWSREDVEGQFGWRLENIRPIEPFPVKGQLNLFSVDCDELKFIEVDKKLEERKPIKTYPDGSFLPWGGLAGHPQCIGCIFSLKNYQKIFPDINAYICSSETNREKVYDRISNSDIDDPMYDINVYAKTCAQFDDGIKPRHYMYVYAEPCPYAISYLPWENVLRDEDDDE